MVAAPRSSSLQNYYYYYYPHTICITSIWKQEQ
jgi:hypothetical protein